MSDLWNKRTGVLIFTDKERKQIARQAKKLAALWTKQGIKPGDPVRPLIPLPK